MTQTVTNELIYEVLKSVQAQVALTREDIASVKSRLTSLDTRLGVVHTDMALLSAHQPGFFFAGHPFILIYG